MNYGDQQHHQYMMQRIPQGQRMPMQVNAQGIPMQPQHQQHIRGQQQINSTSYQMQQMTQGPATPQQVQMRMSAGTGQQLGITSVTGAIVPSSVSVGGPRGVFYQPHGGNDGGSTQRIVLARPLRIYRNNSHNFDDFLNQLPMEIRNQINNEQDPERKNTLLMAVRKQVFEQQRRQHLQMPGVGGMPGSTGMINLQQQQRMVQQHHQQQHPPLQQNTQIVYGNVTGGAQTTSATSNLGSGSTSNMSAGQIPLNTPIHIQRIPSQGSFGTPPSDNNSQQIQTTLVMSSQPSQFQHQQQMMFSGATGGRMGVGSGQPRSFSMTAHHGSQLGVSLAAPNTSMESNTVTTCGATSTGNVGGIPPTMSLQQLNSHQQQQFLQHHQMHFIQQQHQIQQPQNIQHVSHQTSSNILQSSQSQPQLQQPSQSQHLNGNQGGPASHQSAAGLVSSQQNSPMPPHSIGVPQTHCIGAVVGGPGSQPPPTSQQQMASIGTAGPASVPQQPRSIPPPSSTTHQFIGSPSLQQIGGPGSVSSVRPATPSMRSVSSLGGPNSVGGALAAAAVTGGAAPIIDQNAPEYKTSLEQLKGYAGDCKRLITRLRMDGSKLETSVERVIEVIEGRRIVDLKLIKRLIHNVRSTMSSSDPAKGLHELSKKMNNISSLEPPINSLVPYLYQEVRHLQIRVPDSLAAFVKAEEENMIENRVKNMDKLADRTGRRKWEAQENGSTDEIMEDADTTEPPKKRDRSLLVALATSFSTSNDPRSKQLQYKEITSDGPVVRVECLNGNFIILNETISDELTCLRFPHRFDPDYKPISENSPHVQVLIGYKSPINPMASSWISPLRLIIPIDYPKSNVQIFDNRFTTINDHNNGNHHNNGITGKHDVTVPQVARRRYPGVTTSANNSRFDAILDELKMKLEIFSAAALKHKKDETMLPTVLSEVDVVYTPKNISLPDLKATDINYLQSSTSSTLKISVILEIWAEIVERFLALHFKSTAQNYSAAVGHSSLGNSGGALSRNVPPLRLNTVKAEN